MKKRDIGILIGGTTLGMSTVLAGGALHLVNKKFRRQKPKEPKPGSIECVNKMHADYLQRKSFARIKAQDTEGIDITSRDGLLLHASYVHNLEAQREENDPVDVVIFSHGYGGSGYKDLAMFADYYINKGFDLLIIDQRTHGRSEGEFITFGAREYMDISDWTNKVVDIAGNDCRILLHGWSMGAVSIYLAAAHGIAPQVKGLIFDCGYAIAEAQMFRTAKDYSMVPPCVLWYTLQYLKPLCRLICGFDLKDAAPLFVARDMTLPILFVHGAKDELIPLSSGRRLYEATNRTHYRKMLIVPDAGHTYSYVCDKPGYEAAIDDLIEYAMR